MYHRFGFVLSVVDWALHSPGVKTVVDEAPSRKVSHLSGALYKLQTVSGAVTHSFLDTKWPSGCQTFSERVIRTVYKTALDDLAESGTRFRFNLVGICRMMLRTLK